MAVRGLRNAWDAWSAAYDWYLGALDSISDEPLHPNRIRLEAETQGVVHVLELILGEIMEGDPEFYDMLMAEDEAQDGNNEFDPTDYGH